MRSRGCVGLAAGAFLFLIAGGVARAGVDQWDFTGNLSASTGSGTLTLEAGGSLTYEPADINGQTAQVAKFTAGTILRMAHAFAPNGGGAFVNQYTLIMDVMFPDTTGAGGYASLWQTSTTNANDGDWFVQHDVGVGISGNYGGSVTDGVWHRFTLVVDNVAQTLTSYVDGVQAMQNTGGSLAIDGRWSLDLEALLFADNDGETALGYLNSVQFRDRALTAATIAAYGGPTAAGIPVPIQEDFAQADGAPAGWIVYGPTVAVAGEKLLLGPSAAGGELGTILGHGGQPLWIDRTVRIEAKVAFPGNTAAWPFDHGGIFFCAQQASQGRYQNPGSCYVIDYLPKDGATAEAPGRFRLAKFVNGGEQALTQTAQDVTDYEGTWVIELTDTEIILTVNGIERIRHANADLRGGYMGFWAYQAPAENRMTVDDLEVTYTPASCPVFAEGAVALTTGKANEFAQVRIPTGANLAEPYDFTIASADPTVASPVGHTGGALDVTVGVGDLFIKSVAIQPGGPGETSLGLSAGGATCGSTAFVQTLGLFAYEETFTQADGPPAGWYIASQTATVIGESLSLYRGTADPFVWYAIGGTPLSVGKMESLRCFIKFARTTERAVGVHGGMVLAPTVTAARGQGYMIDVIERASDNGFRIYKDNNAAVQLGGPRQPYVWDDQWHEWKITFTPTGFTFSVDGVQLADVADLKYRGGYLSFWCYTGSNQAPQGQNLFVDDIRIEFGASYCPTIAPRAASNRPVNPKTVFTVNAPFGSNLTSDYQLTVTSTDPAVAVPVGATDGSLVLTFPAGGALVQTFEAECLSPGTTDFVVSAEGASCANAFATFTVPEPGLPELCAQFSQADGAPEGWTVYSGSWQVAGGEIVGSCAPGGTPTSDEWIWAGDPPVKFEGAATYEFSMDLTQTTPDGVGAHGGFMVFASSPQHRGLISGYEIDFIGREADHGYRCLRYDNGVATVLVGGLNVPLTTGPASRWKLAVVGNDLLFYADGEYIFGVTDPKYREGYFGFWSYCNTSVVAVDNLGIGVDCLPPTASFTATPESGAAPLDVAFDASASTDNVGIVSYDWDFGDTTTGTGATTGHVYTEVGTYTVVLTVADAYGSTSTATKQIAVTDGDDPVASFTATPESGRAPLEVAFDASASTDNVGIVAYEWDFGDTATATGAQATHVYAAAGTFTALLTVRDAAGNAGTAEKTITVEPAGGRQKPMDFNQDGGYDLSDAVSILNHLFTGGAGPPCATNSMEDAANIALLDANGDQAIDISDAVSALNFLFMGGARPSMCVSDDCPCILIVDCADNAACP